MSHYNSQEFKEKFPQWTSRPWWGNTELGLDAKVKTIEGIQIWVFGKGTDFNFCVHAGANSSYSYTGSFYPDKRDLDETCKQVDELHTIGKLIK